MLSWKKVSVMAAAAVVATLAFASEASAQVTVIGVTPPVPVVVGPPPVVVAPPPAPVVVVGPGPVVAPPPRCATARRCRVRRRRCRRRYVRPVAPVPRDLTIQAEVPKWTIGIGLLSTSYADGGMMGSNLFLRYALSPSVELEGTIGALSSCTACYPNAERDDGVLGLNVYYYGTNRTAMGVSTYLKAGIYSQTLHYKFRMWADDPYGPVRESPEYSQVGLQGGAGFQWKLTDWLGVNVEALLQMPVAGDETEYGEDGEGSVMNETSGKGVPDGSLGKVGLGVNASLSIHF